MQLRGEDFWQINQGIKVGGNERQIQLLGFFALIHNQLCFLTAGPADL